jgi:hypothetical protein
MGAHIPLLSREEAAPLIKDGLIKPVFLHENGDFVYVRLSRDIVRLYRYVDGKPHKVRTAEAKRRPHARID